MPTVPSVEGIFRKNNYNNAWVDFRANNEIRTRNSSNTGWNEPPTSGMVFRRNENNSGWIQLYPFGASTSTAYLSVGQDGLATKQMAYSSWKSGISRQGYNTAEAGGGEQFGMINAGSNNFAGTGYIVDHGELHFTGINGESGNYNATLTITFRGTIHQTFGAGNNDVFSSYDTSGYFSATWDSGGPNYIIPETKCSVNGGGALTWMNGAGGYGANLCMYNGEASGAGGYPWSHNYLGISEFKLSVQNYKFNANVYSLDRPESAARMFSMSSGTPKDDNYLNIVLPEGFEYGTTEQLIQMYESEEIEYVTADKYILYTDFDYRPVILGVEDNIVRTSPIFDDELIVQYRIEDYWMPAFNFEPRRHAIKEGANAVRLIDMFTEEIYYELILN